MAHLERAIRKIVKVGSNSDLIFFANGAEDDSGGEDLEEEEVASEELGLSRSFRLNLGCFVESDLDLQRMIIVMYVCSLTKLLLNFSRFRDFFWIPPFIQSEVKFGY